MHKTSRIRSTRDPNRMTTHSHGYGAAPSDVGEQALSIANQALSVKTDLFIYSVAEPFIDRSARGSRSARWGVRVILFGERGVFINERRVAQESRRTVLKQRHRANARNLSMTQAVGVNERSLMRRADSEPPEPSPHGKYRPPIDDQFMVIAFGRGALEQRCESMFPLVGRTLGSAGSGEMRTVMQTNGHPPAPTIGKFHGSEVATISAKNPPIALLPPLPRVLVTRSNDLPSQLLSAVFHPGLRLRVSVLDAILSHIVRQETPSVRTAGMPQEPMGQRSQVVNPLSLGRAGANPRAGKIDADHARRRHFCVELAAILDAVYENVSRMTVCMKESEMMSASDKRGQRFRQAIGLASADARWLGRDSFPNTI